MYKAFYTQGDDYMVSSIWQMKTNYNHMKHPFKTIHIQEDACNLGVPCDI